MELEIKRSEKKKCKKNRIKKEKKWVPYRVIANGSLAISIVSLIIGIFFVNYQNFTLTGVLGVAFAVFLIVFVIFRALIANLASHWIDDRLNERIWIEGNILNHFIQTSFAAGLNSRHADERGYVFAIDILSITEAKYDKDSKRIEFKSNGQGYHYADVVEKKIDKNWPLAGYNAVFYDYTAPSLYEVLKLKGVSFEITTLNFKIRDNRI